MKDTFTKKELVEFGNYLLSTKRKEIYKNHLFLGGKDLIKRLSQVNDADISNFFDNENNPNK